MSHLSPKVLFLKVSNFRPDVHLPNLVKTKKSSPNYHPSLDINFFSHNSYTLLYLVSFVVWSVYTRLAENYCQTLISRTGFNQVVMIHIKVQFALSGVFCRVGHSIASTTLHAQSTQMHFNIWVYNLNLNTLWSTLTCLEMYKIYIEKVVVQVESNATFLLFSMYHLWLRKPSS